MEAEFRAYKVKHFPAEYFDEEYFRPSWKNTLIPSMTPGHPTWEHDKRHMLPLAKYIKATFKPEKVLDVGCAIGSMCKAFLQLGIDAYGCDISAWAIEHCAAGLWGRLKVADIRDGLPYPDSDFDLVFSDSTLEHVEMGFMDFVVSEMCRVSREWVFLKVPVGLTLKNEPWGDPSHQTYMAPSYWISLFYRYRFLVDLRVSMHGSDPPAQSAQLIFRKEALKERMDERPAA